MSDIVALAKELDAEGMLNHLRNMPDDLAAQWSKSEERGNTPSHMFCLGMGGSAAAGDFLAALADYSGSTPVTRWRDYDLPSWVPEGTLFVPSSYSGNTEETLSATAKAMEIGGECHFLSSGGKLADIAAETGSPYAQVPGGQPPRSAFGHMFGALSRIAEARGVINCLDGWEDSGLIERMREIVTQMDFVNDPESPSLAIARTIVDKEVGIVSASELHCAGVRFANQLNENGGIFARATALPEMNHNEIIAWAEEDAKESQAILFITWDGMSERVGKRVDWMMENVDVDIGWELQCEGSSLLEAMLYSCIAMDWISCAVALLRGKDPSAIGPINSLKGYLADQ